MLQLLGATGTTGATWAALLVLDVIGTVIGLVIVALRDAGRTQPCRSCGRAMGLRRPRCPHCGATALG